MAGALVDYTFYRDAYQGASISEANFPRWAREASLQAGFLTFGRAAKVVEADADAALVEAVRMATCAVAELLAAEDAANGKVITSESVGGHSVSYALPEDAGSRLDQKIARAARPHLANTGLMYCGCYADE